MIFLRSLLFAIALGIVTPLYTLFALLIFWLPPLTRHRLITTWVPMAMWLIRHVLGIRYRVIGRDNIPAGPAVILSKHQSAWETIALQAIFPPLCFVLKRELLRVPFFGWALAQIPEVLEAFLVSGDYDYYIRIAVRDTRDYERLLREQLYRIPGIRHSKSCFVLRRLKETKLPLTGPAA